MPAPGGGGALRPPAASYPCVLTGLDVGPGTPGAPRYADLLGCAGEAGDTTLFFYRDTLGGAPRAAGVSYRVPRARVGPVGDSLAAAFTARYGPPAPCPMDGWKVWASTVRFEQWTADGGTLVLVTDSLAGRGAGGAPPAGLVSVDWMAWRAFCPRLAPPFVG